MTYDKIINENGKNQKLIGRYTFYEELFNGITHGIGALMSIVALIILVAFAGISGDIWRIISLSIYGFTLFFLYLSSTLYHCIFHEKSKQILRIFDHVSIYLLIAGSYTPITLIAMRGAWGWTIFSIIWVLAFVGILLKVINLGKTKIISTVLYVIMGWLIIVAIKPMLQSLPTGLFSWLIAGGITYTLGLIFYLWKKLPYNHGIWHLFVLAGSIIHYLGFLFHLAI